MTENCTDWGGDPADGLAFYATNIGHAVFSAAIAVLAVILNSLVIASVVKSPSLQHTANLLLCSLSASDLLVGLVPLPLYVAARLTRVSAAHNCLADFCWKLYNSVLFIILGASQVQLCIMALDRYKAVSDPFTYRVTVSKRKTITRIAASWLLWIPFSTITNFLIPDPLRMYIKSLTGVIFVVVLIAAQIATNKASRRHNRQIADVNSTTSAVVLAREKKMAVTFAYVTGAIFGCLVVPIVAYTLSFFIKHEGYNKYGVSWGIAFAFLSICTNPLIYFLRHSDMRAAAYRLLGY